MQSSLQTAAVFLDAVTERLIPPTGAWPAATTMGVGADVLPRLRESERAALLSALEMLGTVEEFTARPGPGQDEALRGLEARNPQAFALIRQILYLAYYAQPRVVKLLQSMGYDIQETPQPHGYRMDPFNEERAQRNGPGVWIPTEAVRKRVVSEI